MRRRAISLLFLFCFSCSASRTLTMEEGSRLLSEIDAFHSRKALQTFGLYRARCVTSDRESLRYSIAVEMVDRLGIFTSQHVQGTKRDCGEDSDERAEVLKLRLTPAG